MAKIVVETELGTKQFDKQIQKLKSDLSRYMRVLESDAKVPVSLRMSPAERQQLETTIEKTRNQLISLQQQAQKTGNIGEEAGEKSGKGFEKGLKSLKRFALGLFGIRTAFAGLRRATSAYLAENEVTANKMNAIWVALGNALGPLIEMIADGVLKLIGYLNVFLNALGFKVDLTKNIGKNTRAIKDQTKAQKELNRQTAQFDEMNVMSSNTSSSGGGGASSNAFSMPELDENIVKKLQDIAHWLKENWQYLALIGGLIAGFKLASWLTGLGGLGTALGGIVGWLTAIVGLAAELYALYKFIDEMKNLNKTNKDVVDFSKQVTNETKKQAKTQGEATKQYKKGSKEIDTYVKGLQTQLDMSKDIIAKQKEEQKSAGLVNDILSSMSGTHSKNAQKIKIHLDEMIALTEELGEYAKQGKLTDEQMKIYNETIDYLTEAQKDLSREAKLGAIMQGSLGLVVDDTNKKLYDQIDKLKKDRDQMVNTYDTGNTKVNSFYTNTKNKFDSLNKLKASPTLEIKTDTKKLSEVFGILAKVDGLNSSFASNMSWASSKLKAIGLAKGGIVNLPGRGVTLSNVRIGEATGGAEGIVPLNNEESMSLIGQAVAKYVNINLTNNTLLDGKVIAREQRIVSNNIDFATNGRGV